MKLSASNYIGIVDVAQHCDKSKLEIAQNNAFEYDLKEELCDIWAKVCRLPYGDVILTGNYDKCEESLGDNEEYVPQFGGVLKIWALFSYARYTENSIYTDTGSGMVRKDHSNSFPVQLSELKSISKQHIKMAEVEIERLYSYLCTQTDFFPDSECHCKDKSCDKKQKATMFARGGRTLNREGFR